MAWLGQVDWEGIFIPDTPVLELVVRGSLMYLALFCMLRIMLRRQAGTLSTTDLLLIVLLADAAQNGMAADYGSVPDGIILVITLIFWNYALDWLGYHVPAFERFLNPQPLLLVKNGRIIYANMRRELITKEDLMSRLREKGVNNLKEVQRAWVEGNGKITLIKKE